MNNNDILRRLRYALNLSDKDAIALFSKHPDSTVTMDAAAWDARLAKQEDAQFQLCSDQELTAFLDGLIVARRGLKQPGSASAEHARAPVDQNEIRLSRNDILKKLRIALNLREEQMLALLSAGGTELSKSELGALFRKPGHKHYRACGNQVLRNFIHGLTKQERD